MKKLLLAFVAVVAIMLDFTLADPVEDEKDIEVRSDQTSKLINIWTSNSRN